MLECKRYVSARLPSQKRRSLNYTELGRQALGSFGKWAVDISVLGCNLGVCAGYMIFIAGNLQVRKISRASVKLGVYFSILLPGGGNR